MKRKVSIIVFLALVLATTALLIFISSDRVRAGGIRLWPPFDGTYRTTAYFDHDEPSYGIGADGYIQIYNGERVPSSYANKTGEPYPYDGHDGWDWSMTTGTDVLAAAAGTVVVADWGNWRNGYGRTIVIDHNNGYYTQYSHLDTLLVAEEDAVTAGQHIAESGATPPGTPAHLHFGVRHGGYANTTYAVDPFGWRGEGRDPLFDYNGKESTCLWRSRDEDPISCADTIVEDAGTGSVAFPLANWQVSNRGNGYHTFYRSNTATQYDYHTWSTSTISNPLRPGPCKVYAFVPEDPDGAGGLTFSQQVTYGIWTDSGWLSATVSQRWHQNKWVPLGTYQIPGHGSAGVSAYTGESAGTRWVTADALKWRQYHTFLPLVLNNYCSPHYGQLIVNGYFNTGDNTGWTTSRTNGPEPIVHPYGDTEYGAWLGRYNSNQDRMYQLVCPAAPADYATFSFRWWMSTEETSTTADYDLLYVRIRDANGNLLQTLKTVTNRSPEGDPWHDEFFDLQAYAGQTIRVSFEAATDVSLRTNFWVDWVSFWVYDW